MVNIFLMNSTPYPSIINVINTNFFQIEAHPGPQEGP